MKLTLKELTTLAKGATQKEWWANHNVGFGMQIPEIIHIRGNHGDYLNVNDAMYILSLQPQNLLAILKDYETMKEALEFYASRTVWENVSQYPGESEPSECQQVAERALSSIREDYNVAHNKEDK